MVRATAIDDEALFETNLQALSEFDPGLAAVIRQASPPESALLTCARDGHPTFSWIDESGQRRWLGRTSMPTVSAPPLIDAFVAGQGNVVLTGFGSSLEVRLLLDRTGPHQAVAVVEHDPWQTALALRLRDFSKELRRGRLIVFCRPDPWDDLRRFLVENDGYLTPQRMLAWPWFDSSDIAEVTTRLHQVGAAVAVARADTDSGRSARDPNAGGNGSNVTVAIVTNLADRQIRILASRIQIGAESLGWKCHRFTLDSPAWVRPQAIQTALYGADPSIVLVLGVGPQSLPYALPEVSTCVICSHEHGISADWASAIPPAVRIAFPSTRQLGQAVEFGLDASRLVHTPPAALPYPDAPRRSQVQGAVLIVGDLPATTAEAAGLNLESHRRIWDIAREIVQERSADYVDEQADEILDSARKRLGIRLDSIEVRRGLAERIRRLLGPSVVYRACVRELIDAGIEVSLFGHGWSQDERLAAHHRGPWPDPDSVAPVFAEHAMIVSLRTSGGVPFALLDGIAASLVGCVRAHPADDTDVSLATVLEIDTHVWRFRSPGELVEIVRQFHASPGDFLARAQKAARHVNERHTWRNRLEAIQCACLGAPAGR